MKLNSLEIKNLRCFEFFKISFTPKTTIIIGRNGAGKSTLIDAIKIAISFIFSNNKELGKDFLSAGNPSLNVNSFADSDFRYDSEQGTTAADASIKGIAHYNTKKLNWELYKRSTSGASLYNKKYKDAFSIFMKEWKVNGADLPLIACFSDSFPHKATKQTQFAINSILKDRIPRNFGYYQWNLDTACTSIWEIRLCTQLSKMLPLQAKMSNIFSSIKSMEDSTSHDVLKENDEYLELQKEQNRIIKIYGPLYDEVVGCIQAKLYKFSRKLPKLLDEGYWIDYLSPAILGTAQEILLVFKNGKSCKLNELPAGYRRLYSIVIDLAYRAFILNGKKEPSGIVLIDEIDLHLHPSLEQEVVQCFRDVFPNVQFIMTSHSAAVIANLDTTEKVENEDGKIVPANQLVFMQEGKTDADVLPVIYGLDYNATLRDFMYSSSRNENIKAEQDEYLRYCSLGLKDEAQAMITSLIERGIHENIIKDLQEKAKVYEVH